MSITSLRTERTFQAGPNALIDDLDRIISLLATLAADGALGDDLDTLEAEFDALEVEFDAHVADAEAHQDLVTLGAGSDPILTLNGQELTMGEIVEPADLFDYYGYMAPEIIPVVGLNFPVFRRIVGAQKIAAAFPHGDDSGWAASWQLAKVLGAYNLGLVIEWHATNATGSSKGVVLRCSGRVVAVGEDVDSGGTSFSENMTVTIPDGTTEVTLQADYLPLVAFAGLADDDMVIVEAFYRDVSQGGDTLEDELLISGWKPYWTDRVVSPTE